MKTIIYGVFITGIEPDLYEVHVLSEPEFWAVGGSPSKAISNAYEALTGNIESAIAGRKKVPMPKWSKECTSEIELDSLLTECILEYVSANPELQFAKGQSKITHEEFSIRGTRSDEKAK